MKKYKILIIGLIIIAVIICSLYLLKMRKFNLEKKYYGNNTFIELSTETYEEIIDNKESFVIFIYQPMCVTSNNFESVINEFMKKNNISIYKMKYSFMLETNLKDYINYYPSFAIIKNGKLVDHLDANSNEDINMFKNLNDFTNWFEKYVLKESK